MNRLETPVAFLVFNRPETTRRVFAAIAAARPSHLLLIADGPRADRTGETQRCEEVRKIISSVNWPCKVETNFSNENLGCRRRVISGLDWVFSLVEEAIILEDDCLPDPSFFAFCSELLVRYRNERKVGFIAGFNALETSLPFKYSYSFSMLTGIWGWATWRRSWRAYDEHLTNWPQAKRDGLLNHIFNNERRSIDYWTQIFDAMHDGTGPNAWGYQWVYTSLANNWLSALPARNLIQNIGFGEGATHTTAAAPLLTIPSHPIEFPLRHPPVIEPWPSHVEQLQKTFFTPNILRRIRQKMSWSLRLDTKA